MPPMKNDLPIPSAEALNHSQQLTARILERINGGRLSFADFMQACLYEPGLGYYGAGSRKFGAEGDFITAPLVSPLFAYTLAQATSPVIQKTQGSYLELGAGNGQMAYDILRWLTEQGDPRTQYFILEISPDCRAQQAEKLAVFGDRVQWLDSLPKQFKGVILANEVLDALPVHLFHYKKQDLFERQVAWQHNEFTWVDVPLTDPLIIKAVQKLDLPQSSRENYLSEINPTLPMFIRSLINSMAAGQLVFLDYGFLSNTYYHQDRTMGTLMCHYRHHAHTDPFLYPGLQDITAHVDFTAVGLAARAAGAEVALYSQAEFLLMNGLLELFQSAFEGLGDEAVVERARLSQDIQKLVQPHEMGELFKVMVIDL
jgi:SAM-dependent MidA family methyltransferase